MYAIKRIFHGRKFSLYFAHPREALIREAACALKGKGKRYRLLDDGYTFFLYSS